MNIYTCMYMYIYIHEHLRICVYIHIHIYVYMYVYMYRYMYKYMETCIAARNTEVGSLLPAPLASRRLGLGAAGGLLPGDAWLIIVIFTILNFTTRTVLMEVTLRRIIIDKINTVMIEKQW